MSEQTRRLSHIKWQATGVDGHTYHTCGEWQYTSDAPPVEADEYERMKARAYEAEAKVADATLRAEVAEHALSFADSYSVYYHEHEMARRAGVVSEHAHTFDVWYLFSGDASRYTRALMREGELVASDSEGGFGPDEISIGGDNMSELIAKWMGLQLNGRGSLCPIKGGQIELGLVLLILERL